MRKTDSLPRGPRAPADGMPGPAGHEPQRARPRPSHEPAAGDGGDRRLPSFRKWWPVAGHDDYPAWAFSTIANEVTSGFADFGQLELSAEPRSAWNNSAVNARNNVTEEPWYEICTATSPPSTTRSSRSTPGSSSSTPTPPRGRSAVGKFMQGVSHGYLALYFDSAFVVDENLALDTITVPQLRHRSAVITAADRDARLGDRDRAAQHVLVARDPGSSYTAMTATSSSGSPTRSRRGCWRTGRARPPNAPRWTGTR